jgi:hypothetical protein
VPHWTHPNNSARVHTYLTRYHANYATNVSCLADIFLGFLLILYYRSLFDASFYIRIFGSHLTNELPLYHQRLI